MVVSKVSDSKYKLIINSFFKDHIGQVIGLASIVGSKVVYSSKEFDECTIELESQGSKLVVKQDGGCGMGANVSASGEYALDTKPVTANEIKMIEKSAGSDVTSPLEYRFKPMKAEGKAFGKQGDFAAHFESKSKTYWCKTVASGTLKVGKSQKIEGLLTDPVFTWDEGGKAFYLKDCVVK